MKYLLLILPLLFFTKLGTAQRTGLSGGEAVYFHKSGTLRTDGAISGYYIINYREPEEAPGYYVLQLLDQELNEVGKKPLPQDENLRIGEVAYNGQLLAIEMIDHIRERKWIEVYDGQGEFQYRRQMTYSVFDLPQATGATALYGGKSLVAADGGFLHFNLTTDGKRITSDSYYRVTYIPNDDTDRGWTTRSSSRIKESQGAVYLTSNDSVVVFGVFTMQGSKLSTKCTMEVMAYGVHSGKKLFTYTPGEEATQTRFIKGQIVGDRLILVGTNVGKSSKLFTDHPEGVDVIKLSLDGKLLEKSSLSIADDLAAYFDVTNQGKVKGLGSLFIHDIGMTAGEELVIAGEFYRVFNGDIQIEEGLLIQLTPTLDVATVKLVDKGRTGSMLDGGILSLANAQISFARGPLVAATGKVENKFDFAFLHEGAEVITTAYFIGRSEARKNKHMSLLVNTLLDGELIEDRLEFEAASDWVIVLPAKEGYLAVIEYSTSQKSLDIHMERLRL